MIKELVFVTLIFTITSTRFLEEEQLDFSVKVDFQGFNQCLQQNKLENEDNIQIVDYIKTKEYVDASLLAFAQLKKGNQIVKKCNKFLPSMNSLTKIVNAACTSSWTKKPSSGYAILESFLGNTESNPIVISFKSDSSGSNKPNVINVDNRTYKPCKKATSGYA